MGQLKTNTMKITKHQLKQASNFLGGKAYEKEDVPIILAEYRKKLIYDILKFILMIIITSIPFILNSYLIKTESLTIYTSIEEKIFDVTGVMFVFFYVMGVYSLVYRESFLKKSS